MIASQKIGKSFMGALNYNLRKLEHTEQSKRALLLSTNFTSLDKAQIAREVELVRGLRPRLNRYVYHTSLNFHKDDQLDNATLLKIAQHYLAASGYTENQHFIFRHNDADHPHLHLLVNRITFAGKVVSDSNNFKKSEQVLRAIERQYNLVQVNQSKNSSLRAATKDELEMVIRTGTPSDKMLLQEKLSLILKQSKMNLQDFIQQCEFNGIYLLFNQQSTGRISGITYFHGRLIIKGQKLGNKFKCAELIKQVNYEQIRDSKTISEANSRTKRIYETFTDGKQITTGNGLYYGNGSDGIYSSDSKNVEYDGREQADVEDPTQGDKRDRNEPLEAGKDADLLFPDSVNTLHHHRDEINIEIRDDEDDAKYRRRRRYLGR